MTALWSPVKIGRLTLAHRLAMAPMTRSRAQYDGTPGAKAAEYYAQRASMGLLISEGTQPSEDGQGYTMTPGLYTEAHIEGWRKVAEAVHKAGGHLFVQLMHAGRIAHPDNTPHHRQPVGPSAISASQPMFTPTGLQQTVEPRALSAEDVKRTIADFVTAARAAVAAGADGVELHGANGYLIQQFFAPNANTRSDQYGGTLENRARFAIEVVKAVAAAIGPERTALRLSPLGNSGGLEEGPEAPALYRHLVKALDGLDLAYLHIMHLGNEELLKDIRGLWHHPLIVNRPGAAREVLARDLEAGLADMVSVGQMALANPDLIKRLKTGAPLNTADRPTFFGGGDAGYTDYPVLAE